MSMFKGLSAFPVTPSDDAGRIDTEALQRRLLPLVEAGVQSIGLLGSTGSYPYFSRAERLRAIRAGVECVAGRVPLLVGVGALRTDETIELTREAQAAGASAGLLAPVSYIPLLDDEVFEHFRAVTRASDLPLVIYNNPGTTHFTFTPPLIGRLAALPTVQAVKNPAPAPAAAAAALAELRPRVPAAFSLGFSADVNAAQAMLAGGAAWYSVLGGTYPRTCLRLAAAAQAGDAALVQQLHAALDPLWALFARYTSYRVVHLAGGAPPTRPVLPLSGAAAAEVHQVLEALALD